MSDEVKTGPACFTCRKTCRRCDRARPACQRCLDKGVQCGGYPEKFRFCGPASRGKLKHLNYTNTTAPSKSPLVGLVGTGRKTARRDSKKPSTLRPTSQVLLDTFPTLDTVLLNKRVEVLLGYYDKVICPHQIAMIQDDTENPYRKYILPLAYEHLAPLYAILGLAACHQGIQEDDLEMRDNEAVHYQSQAIRSLLQLLEKETTASLSTAEYDALLATIQILVLHDICESGVSTHGAHVTGSGGIGSRLLAQGRIHPRNDRTVFFVGNLAWLDVLRAFSGSERMCFSWDLLQAVAEASGSHFERVNGIPRGMFLIMGEVLWDAKHYEMGELSEGEYIDKLDGALDALKKFVVSIGGEFSDNGQGWTFVAEAFRHACILHVLRLLDISRPAYDHDIQRHVKAVLEATAEIPPESPLIELLIMPLFVAGTDTIEKHSRRYVINAIDLIWARSGMANSTPKSLLLRVWDARDNQDPKDETYVSWQKFTRSASLERQHDYYII